MTSRYEALLAQKAELEREIEEAHREESAGAIDQCKQLIALYSLNAHDLGLIKTQQVAGAKVRQGDKTFAVKTPRAPTPPKYRDPATGATWSGMGKAPQWIAGQTNRDEFLIRA